MAFSRVQATSGDQAASATPAISFGSATTANNTIIVAFVLRDGTTTVSSVTDSGSNTYSKATNITSGVRQTYIYYSINAAAATTITLHLSASVEADIWMEEVSGGIASLGPVVSEDDTGVASNSMTLASQTLTAAAWGAAIWRPAGTYSTPGTGWSTFGTVDAHGYGSEDGAFASGSAQPTATSTGTQGWQGSAAFFYGAAGAPTQPWSSYPERVLAAPANRALREAGFYPAAPPVLPTFNDVIVQAHSRQSYPEKALRPVPARTLFEWAELATPPILPTFNDVLVNAANRQSYPERLLRQPPVAQQRENAWVGTAAPERTAPFAALAAFPDQVLGAPPRKDYATEVGAPERSQTYLDADFPDRITRPFLLPMQQQAALDMAPAPETLLPNDFYASYPDVARAARPVAQQRENAWIGTAVPERTTPMAITLYPDQVLGAPPRRDYVTEQGSPIANQAAPVIGYWSYPDQVLPAARIRTLPEWAELATPPILPTFSDVVAQAWGRQSYPERALRAVMITAQQMAELDMWPLPIPNQASPVIGYWSYPDQVLGPPPRRDYVTEVGRPERTTPLASASFPDQVLGAPPRKDYATEVGKPEATVSQDFYASYPDRVLAQAPVAQQQAFTSQLAPERTIPLVDTRYPESILRPTGGQPFTPAWPIQPPAAVTRVQAWSSYPDAFPPRVVRTLDHLAASEQPPLPRPNIVPTIVTAVFPDVIRPGPQYLRILIMQSSVWRPGAMAKPLLVLVSSVKAAGS